MKQAIALIQEKESFYITVGMISVSKPKVFDGKIILGLKG